MIILVLITSLTAFNAEAKPAEKKCKITPATKIGDAPKKFVTTNNLRQKTGSVFVAEGSPIYIKGNIVDENCVPISDVTIELWQANAIGTAQYNPRLAKKGSVDSNFNPTGVASSDNLGNFQFTSIAPAVYENLPPHLHLRFKDKLFKQFDVRMFLDDHKDKGAIPAIIEPVNSNDLSKGYIYKIQVVAKADNPYRRF